MEIISESCFSYVGHIHQEPWFTDNDCVSV